jgi:hypothetical protein
MNRLTLTLSRTIVTPTTSTHPWCEITRAAFPSCVPSCANPSGLGHAATNLLVGPGTPGSETSTIAKTNTEKITKEILEGLSKDTDDSDSYDAESGGEDSEDWPWQPSHAVFGKSTIKQSHLDNMRGRYF